MRTRRKGGRRHTHTFLAPAVARGQRKQVCSSPALQASLLHYRHRPSDARGDCQVPADEDPEQSPWGSKSPRLAEASINLQSLLNRHTLAPSSAAVSPGTGPHLPDPTWTSESSRTWPCKMEKTARTRPPLHSGSQRMSQKEAQRGAVASGMREQSTWMRALVPRKSCSAHPGSIRAQFPCHPGSSVTPGSSPPALPPLPPRVTPDPSSEPRPVQTPISPLLPSTSLLGHLTGPLSLPSNPQPPQPPE